MDFVLDFISSHLLIYVLLIVVIGSIVTYRIYRKIIKNEAHQRDYLLNIRKYQSVKTSSPLRNPVKIAKEVSLRNLRKQFTVIRSVLIPGMIVITALIAAFPYIGTLPGNIISLFIAALTLILGITIRAFLSNAISGIALTFSKLFRVGDTVKINGIYGVIYDISSTHTTVKIWDWRHYIIPNEELLRSDFINYSIINKYLWVSVEFRVDYKSDIDTVRRISKEVPKRSECYADYEEPKFWVMDMEERHVRCMLTAWANNPADGWILSSDIRFELIKEFQKRQIIAHSINFFSFADNEPKSPATPKKQVTE